VRSLLAAGRIQIRLFARDDWDSVLAIYLEGIATGQATFETAAPSWERWDSGHLNFARLVAVSDENGQLAGWAALSPVSSRSVYSGVAEVSVYVGSEFRGQGWRSAARPFDRAVGEQFYLDLASEHFPRKHSQHGSA
jgi:L-amino acid N-acyltransferase YncA